MTTTLSEDSILYPNFTNYVYEVPQADDGDRFLLFNPSVHYWIATDARGAALIRELGGTDLRFVKKWAAANCGVRESAFSRDVLPFVETLVELGFFALHATPRSAGWVPPSFDLQEPARYPFNDIYVSLVDACNLDCVYCFNKEERAKRRRQSHVSSIPWELACKAMEEFKSLGGSGVCFTGGEPTLHPDFLSLCEAGKRLDLTTHVITNGTLLKSLDGERLVRCVDSLSVSLDTLDQALIPGLWGTDRYRARDDLLAPLKEICDLAAARGAAISIKIKPIVAAANLASLQPMVEEVTRLLGDRAVSWDFTRYEPIGKPEVDGAMGVSETGYVTEMLGCARALCGWQLPSVSEGLGQASTTGIEDKGLLRAVLSHGGKLLPGREVKVMPCVPSFFATGGGNVYPCQELEMEEFLLGNLATGSLREMFYHPAFAALRDKMTVDDLEVCGGCEFRYVCARHCHGRAQRSQGRTTAFSEGDGTACRTRIIKQLWLETQVH